MADDALKLLILGSRVRAKLREFKALERSIASFITKCEAAVAVAQDGIVLSFATWLSRR